MPLREAPKEMAPEAGASLNVIGDPKGPVREAADCRNLATLRGALRRGRCPLSEPLGKIGAPKGALRAPKAGMSLDYGYMASKRRCRS